MWKALRDSLIQRFEFCYELAWKTLKLWLEGRDIEAHNAKDVLREPLAQGTFADVDMAIFAPELSFEEFLRLRAALDDLPILFKLDTVHFDTIGTPDFKESILKEGIPFYHREAVRTPRQDGQWTDEMFVREGFNGPPIPT